MITSIVLADDHNLLHVCVCMCECMHAYIYIQAWVIWEGTQTNDVGSSKERDEFVLPLEVDKSFCS